MKLASRNPITKFDWDRPHLAPAFEVLPETVSGQSTRALRNARIYRKWRHHGKSVRIISAAEKLSNVRVRQIITRYIERLIEQAEIDNALNTGRITQALQSQNPVNDFLNPQNPPESPEITQALVCPDLVGSRATYRLETGDENLPKHIEVMFNSVAGKILMAKVVRVLDVKNNCQRVAVFAKKNGIRLK